MKCYIAIPTFNAGTIWKTTVSSIKENIGPDFVVHIIDSGSDDDTVEIASNAGFDIVTISGSEFNHGRTRNMATDNFLNQYEIVIFLTQDAIPQKGFIDKIIDIFENPDIACAYGRQVPHVNANPIAKHARYFNYPSESYIVGKDDINTKGLKTAFMSNSFSAYRLSMFKELGGFPGNTILCEDMFYTAKAILAGYKVAYVSEAVVSHSHNYTPIDEFKRYFDIGVFHTDEYWLRESFGGAGSEGKKFIISEFIFLLKNAPGWIPLACINNFMKLIGYKLGQKYRYLPKCLIKKLSMHKRYWMKRA
ncbi:TPA: glycosyltransferase family 2 protein [Klebsiella pneumoniae]|uniref:glycosyltransferase family 2 protein n=1 Tax=Klebsiella sp. 10982 TaxID=1196034 RepID=UPI0004704652|nr:glycosyltransferase [Klebsiella sp. 10982]HBX7141809.1 glycosyltransferase family 2 protein [Klebsiella pneumoniae]